MAPSALESSPWLEGAFALCDDNLGAAGHGDGESYLFLAPRAYARAADPAEMPALFANIEAARRDGLFAVGYVAYEAASGIDPGLRTQSPTRGAPLAEFGLFETRLVLKDAEIDAFLGARAEQDGLIHDLFADDDKAAYLRALMRIRAEQEAGETYQVNHTFRCRLNLSGCPLALYRKLRMSQPVAYGALLRFPGVTMLSRSPELFFRKQGARLETKPMKGTAKRGATPEEDSALGQGLTRDEKSRAENVMIVDLLRNDLGRVALGDSVRVDALFDVETYKSLHQMTSTISCEVDPALGVGQVFGGLFPCGSVTGAPKRRTMEIIADLESSPRGVYCGAIGYVTPDNDMCFNVPIRTLTLHADGENRFVGEFGIGSGVVHDSDPEAEHRECLLKGGFLFRHRRNFALLEAMRFDPGVGLLRRDKHLDRLERAAALNLFNFDREAAIAALDAAIAPLTETQKIRLRLAQNGEIEIAVLPRKPHPPEPPFITVAEQRMRADNPYLRFKNSMREIYEDTYTDHQARFGAYDAVFLNERGEVTETARHNIFVKIDGRYVTPPLSCGALDGVSRAEFIARHDARECVLSLGDLERAEEIVLTNTVIGSIVVELRLP